MRLSRTLSLRQRIIVSVALGLSLVLLVPGYVAVLAQQQSIDAAFSQRQLLAKMLASHADDMLGRHSEILKRTVELPGIDLEDGDVELEKAILRKTQMQMGDFSQIVLLDASGNVLWTEPENGEMAKSRLSSDLAAIRVVETHQPSIAELRVPSGEPPQVCLATPIHNERGLLTGVLMARLRADDSAIDLIPKPKAGDPTVVELVNGDGIVVASTYGVREGKRQSLHPGSLLELRRLGALAHEGVDGKKHIVAYAPLSSVASWGVMVERPEDVVLALSIGLQQQLVIFSIMAVVAGAILAWVDVRRVVGPLGALTSAAARMSTGDLNSPIKVRRRDEIGVLASALESMRSRLKDLLEERERWNAELESRVEQRTKDLSSLLEAATALSSILDPDELWGAIMDQTKRLCPAADGGLLLVYEKDRDRLVYRAGLGCHTDGTEPVEFRPDEGLLGTVFRSGQPMLIEGDGMEGCREGDGEERLGQLRRACQQIEIVRSAICMPLVTKQESLGCLMVCSFQEQSPLSQNDLRLLQAFAVQAATAVENARLYGEVQRKELVRGDLLTRLITVQEEERRRIARELHDDSAQALTALIMAVESAEETLPGEAVSQRHRLERAKGLVSRALGDLRRMIWDLRPAVLDDLGLAPAVRWFAEQRLDNASVEVNVQMGSRLPTAVETEVYRILQEAITNVARHSGASQVGIRLSQNNGTLVAVVEDNGAGFDAGDVHRSYGRHGLGLVGMEERAGLLGGSLTVESIPGRGTRLTIVIPAN